MSRNSRADDWIACDCGREHWGLAGAAGLLLARPTEDGLEILLQHRAGWSDGGATWGIPGGALEFGETPETAALRETQEEAGVNPDVVSVIGTSVLDHGNWKYTTVIGFTTHDIEIVIDDESLAMEWIDMDRVAAMPLLAAFAGSWDGLRQRLMDALLVSI